MVLDIIHYGRCGQTIAFNEYVDGYFTNEIPLDKSKSTKPTFITTFLSYIGQSLQSFMCDKSFERQIGENNIYGQTICYPPKIEILGPTEWYHIGFSSDQDA